MRGRNTYSLAARHRHAIRLDSGMPSGSIQACHARFRHAIRLDSGMPSGSIQACHARFRHAIRAALEGGLTDASRGHRMYTLGAAARSRHATRATLGGKLTDAGSEGGAFRSGLATATASSSSPAQLTACQRGVVLSFVLYKGGWNLIQGSGALDVQRQKSIGPDRAFGQRRGILQLACSAGRIGGAWVVLGGLGESGGSTQKQICERALNPNWRSWMCRRGHESKLIKPEIKLLPGRCWGPAPPTSASA
eukprot:1142382-Pelagomonas_calceolata.AAC.9